MALLRWREERIAAIKCRCAETHALLHRDVIIGRRQGRAGVVAVTVTAAGAGTGEASADAAGDSTFEY